MPPGGQICGFPTISAVFDFHAIRASIISYSQMIHMTTVSLSYNVKRCGRKYHKTLCEENFLRKIGVILVENSVVAWDMTLFPNATSP